MTTSRSNQPFDPRILDKTTIAVPLLERIRGARQTPRGRTARAKDADDAPIDVIIDVNLDYALGREEARESVYASVREAIEAGGTAAREEALDLRKSRLTNQYVFARLRGRTILALVEIDKRKAGELTAAKAAPKGAARAPAVLPKWRAIYRIWPDFEVEAHCTRSIATVKVDAAQRAFLATGTGIVWAVIDSGIQGDHPHFAEHANLVDLPSPAEHVDFTLLDAQADAAPTKKSARKARIRGDATALEDEFGHGTHVAGIIAGVGREGRTNAATRRKSDGDADDDEFERLDVGGICGMAPRCKLLSLKVLDAGGRGKVSNIIAALALIQELNAHGRRLVVHGINLSVGYGFDAEWFACGQSPLCVEVNRLVKSGVVVVVAAGNTGYGVVSSTARGDVKTGMDLTINDPGNADLAITVGSTHREMPHVYGVSYFSSKGPTGDGRLKPDLVAPGEKILSCAAGAKREQAERGVAGRGSIEYVEDSGTSMAAPHVSGVIAAFLSIRREFIGCPEQVKSIVTSTATDLKRDPHFQGRGLVDLMRAIQSV